MAAVLIADDDSEIRAILRKIVMQLGHEAVEAGTGVEAEACLDRRFDLMLVDIDMPEETGIDFVMKVRQQPELEDVPVVFITAYPQRSQPLQMTGQGALQVIPKPFRVAEVRDLVQRILGSRGTTQWKP